MLCKWSYKYNNKIITSNSFQRVIISTKCDHASLQATQGQQISTGEVGCQLIQSYGLNMLLPCLKPFPLIIHPTTLKAIFHIISQFSLRWHRLWTWRIYQICKNTNIIFLGLKTLTHLFLVQPFSTLKNIRKA